MYDVYHTNIIEMFDKNYLLVVYYILVIAHLRMCSLCHWPLATATETTLVYSSLPVDYSEE